MRQNWAWVAVVVISVAATGCSPRGSEQAETAQAPVGEQEPEPPGKQEHDRAVSQLEERVGDEDGWLTYTLPNGNEGGGETTWWMHPCDPGIDDERDITATQYQGSDIGGELGYYRVEEFRAECVAPSREIQVGGRDLVLDVDVMPLWRTIWAAPNPSSLVWVHDPGVESVTITDQVDGREYMLERSGDRAEGACDGATTWGVSWRGWEGVYLSGGTSRCIDTFAALPDGLLGMLDDLGSSVDESTWSYTFPDVETLADVRGDIEALFETEGWEPFESETPDGVGWRGPCLEVDEASERTVATMGVVDAHIFLPDLTAAVEKRALLSVRSEPCRHAVETTT